MQVVSTSCLKEVNRLSDLPLNDIPVKPATKVTGKNDVANPAKKTKVVKTKPKPVKKHQT